MERDGRRRAPSAALGLALLLVVGRASCQLLDSGGPERTNHVNPPRDAGPAATVFPGPHAIVFPESRWASRFGQYEEEVESPEYVPMEGQLCPSGHQLVNGECKLVLA